MSSLSGNRLFEDREILEEEIRRLGVRIDLEPDIRRTLLPATVGGRTVGNRFVIHPMEGCDGTLEGEPDELTFRRWGRFGAGGAKIVWGEATAVVPEARANPRQLLASAATNGALARLVDHTRVEHRRTWGSDDDLLVGLQLTHSGRWSKPQPIPLSDVDWRRLADAYVAAATIAAEAGFDFVDLKQCHGYLLSERLAGPGSLEHRLGFALEVLGRIRDQTGLLLATRLNAYDGPVFVTDPEGHGEPDPGSPPGFGVADGLEPDLAEPIQATRLLHDAGVALVNVTAGCPYTNFHIGRPADRPAVDGYQPPEHPLVGVDRHFRLAAAIQEAFPELGVVGTGYSYLRHFLAEAGEANVRSGRVGFVGVGRGALAYPDFVADLVEHGTMDPRKVCVTVSHCTTLMRSKGNDLGQYPTGCVPRDPPYAKLLQEVRRSR